MSESLSTATKRSRSTSPTLNFIKKSKSDDTTSSAVLPADTIASSTTPLPPVPTTTESVPPVATTNDTTLVESSSTVRADEKRGKKGGKVNQKDNKAYKRKVKVPKAGGAEETGHFDVLTYLGATRVDELRALEVTNGDGKRAAELEWGVGAEGKDIEVRIVGISAHGDGLAVVTPKDQDEPTRMLTIPFALPTELCLVHVHRHEPETLISHADLLSIIEPSAGRSLDPGEVRTRLGAEATGGEASETLQQVRKKFGERVQCQYFGVCSGCQYQPLSYSAQLLLKQDVVANAFKNFSRLPASAIPSISPTLPSPKEYGYRTKLTPHFQTPPTSGFSNSSGKNKKGKGRGNGKEVEVKSEENEVAVAKEWELTIGFEQKGRKRVIDIEECVIATQVINDALTIERQKVKDTIASFKRGATILLRDSLPLRPANAIRSSTPSTEPHVCITDHHATVREQIGNLEFEQMAGSFFQNNSSILPSLLEYVATALRASNEIPAASAIIAVPVEEDSKRYLIDTYCGSGLFAIGLADQFDVIEGVEIDKSSVKWARQNATFNDGEGRGKVGFKDGKAEAIFDSIKFPAHLTTIVIDPPRKGCDDLFLSQLLAFNPATIVYVSCNVHTQARDIGWLIRESEKRSEAEGVGEGMERKGVFVIESLRAADLFANTHHAEGVAVLRRV